MPLKPFSKESQFYEPYLSLPSEPHADKPMALVRIEKREGLWFWTPIIGASVIRSIGVAISRPFPSVITPVAVIVNGLQPCIITPVALLMEKGLASVMMSLCRGRDD